MRFMSSVLAGRTFDTAGIARANAQSVTLAAVTASLRRNHRGHLDAGHAPPRRHKPLLGRSTSAGFEPTTGGLSVRCSAN
jgi:hypothetical protein